MSKKSPRKRKSGFTLIELAIIIAVIGILGAVGAVKFSSMTQQAQDSAAVSTLANMRSALAIAIAKSSNGLVKDADYATYLEPAPTGADAAFATFKWNGYTVTFGDGDDANNITSIKKVVNDTNGAHAP